MLDEVKQSLRITTNKLDIEIIGLIEAAKDDMMIAGVVKVDENSPIIKRAIMIYCKANFGLDNKDSERYQRAYDILIQRLTLCGDYNVV